MSKGSAIHWTPEMLEEYVRRKDKTLAEAKQALAEAAGALKRSKYRSQKVEVDGIKFDSKKEARRWAELEMMQADGRISGLQRQVPFVLAPAVKLAGEARTKPALRYVADFVYMLDGAQTVEDIKSAPTRKLPAYRMKRHLMATVHGIHIKEV